MSDDSKTLANAQPGGRVRLGDQAERARFEAWAEDRELDTAKCSADGMKGDYADLNTDWCWAAWQAALSAKPSPGGQDALREAAEFARRVLAEIYATYQVKIGPFASQAQLANVKLGSALAARQPVGQGDAPPCWWIDHGTYGQITQRQDEADAAVNAGERVVSYAARQPVGEQPMEMRICELRHVSLKPNRPYIFTIDANCASCRADAAYAMGHTDTRPAQAVDLGAVRQAVRKAWQKCAAGESVDLQFGTLLALIDSQAVGNG